MAMSRKNYIAVAAAFAAELPHYDGPARDALRAMAERMAQIFRADNSAFQPSRFMAACGF